MALPNPAETGAPAPAPESLNPLASHVNTGEVEITDGGQRKLLIKGINFNLNPGTAMTLREFNGGFKLSLTKEQ